MHYLEIHDKLTGTSWVFNNIQHIPNVGDVFTLFEDDTGDVVISGIVESRHWSMLELENSYTVTITIKPAE